MGKGERRGGRRAAAGRRRRNRRHRHNHHRSGTGTAPGIRFMRQAVPGTEHERYIYARALTLSITCYCLGSVFLISGVIGFLVMLYIAISLLSLALLSSVWTFYLYKKLKLAEASVTSTATVTSTQPTTTGLNTTTTLPVFMLGNRIGLSNSTSNINSQTTENGISNTMFTVGSGNLSSSQPNIATPSYTHLPGTPYHYPNQIPLDQQGIDANKQLILSTLASYCQNKNQSIEIPSVPAPTNYTTIDMEPPPPSYEDVVKY